jgi:sulfonate transport system ATP-binding protein
VALADRVLVLEDGRVSHTLVIDDARRSPSDPSANTERYRAELLDKLGVHL